MITSWLSVHIALIVGYLLAIVGIAHMLRHRRSPSATIAWLLAFVLFPYVGVAVGEFFTRLRPHFGVEVAVGESIIRRCPAINSQSRPVPPGHSDPVGQS